MVFSEEAAVAVQVAPTMKKSCFLCTRRGGVDSKRVQQQQQQRRREREGGSAKSLREAREALGAVCAVGDSHCPGKVGLGLEGGGLSDKSLSSLGLALDVQCWAREIYLEGREIYFGACWK